MAKLKITETVLRDAHQSLLATRMSMDDMREILPEIDKIGFYSAECWGGATFDSCIRFLMKIHGKDFVYLEKKCLTQSSRCFSEVRICLATVTMLMTLLSILYRSLLQWY